jgi:hypothetical protein
MPAPKKRPASSTALLRAAERRSQLRECIDEVQREKAPLPPRAPAVGSQPGSMQAYVSALVYRNGQKGDRVQFDAPSFDAARKHAASIFMADRNAIGVLVREAHADQS